MKRYVLTGAPGAGKTALLRLMERRGYAVVEEAATDVMDLATAQGRPEPWKDACFIDDIVALQRTRQQRAQAHADAVTIFDRSPVCTWALCEYLSRTPPPALVAEMERIEREAIYELRVLFVDNLGFITPTEARRISFEDALRFERVHEEVYARFGYDCVRIAAADLDERFEQIRRVIG